MDDQESAELRRAAKSDANQTDIVDALRKIPGVTVETGHHDILVGYQGVTRWFEIKDESAVSPITGFVRPSELTPSEQHRLETWTGYYLVVWSLDQILEELRIK